jgi:hypothetical protein
MPQPRTEAVGAVRRELPALQGLVVFAGPCRGNRRVSLETGEPASWSAYGPYLAKLHPAAANSDTSLRANAGIDDIRRTRRSSRRFEEGRRALCRPDRGRRGALWGPASAPLFFLPVQFRFHDVVSPTASTAARPARPHLWTTPGLGVLPCLCKGSLVVTPDGRVHIIHTMRPSLAAPQICRFRRRFARSGPEPATTAVETTGGRSPVPGMRGGRPIHARGNRRWLQSPQRARARGWSWPTLVALAVFAEPIE